MITHGNGQVGNLLEAAAKDIVPPMPGYMRCCFEGLRVI